MGGWIWAAGVGGSMRVWLIAGFMMLGMGNGFAADPLASTPVDPFASFIADGKATVHFRTMFFDRDKPNNSESEAWAAGGWLGYETGWLADMLQFGAVGYTSQPIYAPQDKPGTGLLQPIQQQITVLGQAYATLRYGDQLLKAGRQYLDTPQVNPNDSRMIPNTFQGIMLSGKALGAEYYLGYLNEMKLRNSETFSDFAYVAGVSNHNEGMVLTGLKLNPLENLHSQFSLYYVPNILTSPYADANWRVPLTDDVSLLFGGQFMYQTSNGEDLYDGSQFETCAWGLKTDLTWRWITLQGARTQTCRGGDYDAPYGKWAGYTSMIIRDFDDAGETAWLVGSKLDLGGIGLTGLSATGLAVFGSNAINPDTGESVADNTEYDLTVDYALAKLDVDDWLKPLSLRGRAAVLYADQDGDVSRTTDFRLILNYEQQF